MNLFEGMLLNMIFIIFPVFIYLFYLIQTKNIEEKNNALFLDFAFVSSVYLSIRFGMNFFPLPTLFLITIPLFLAYQNHHMWCGILISLILLSVQLSYYHENLWLLIMMYSIYFIIYLLFSYKKIREKYMMLCYLFSNVFFTLFYMIRMNILASQNFSIYIQIFILIITVFFVPYLLLKLLVKGNEIVHFHLSLKELEQQKQFQNSLFKITHEIKNPIAVCKGYLDMFDVNNSEHSKKYIPILKEEIERTLVLIQDFLATNHVKIEKEEMDMNMLLEEVIHNFKPILKKNHIQLQLDLQDEEYYMMGDYYRLNQVFINILKNAIEAIKENGILSISTKLTDNQLFIYIKDNGVGITLENLKKIAEPFFTTKEYGTGLGVGLSMEIVKKHQGTMKYYSKEGNGTTVELVFPLLESL